MCGWGSRGTLLNNPGWLEHRLQAFFDVQQPAESSRMARTRAVALPLLLLAAAACCTLHETFVAPRAPRVQPASGAVQPAQGKVARQAVDGATGAAVASWLIVGGAWNKAMAPTEAAAPVNADAKWMWAPQQDEKMVYFLSAFMLVCVYFFGPWLFP